MSDPTPPRQARNRSGALQVYVTERERAIIETNAKAAGKTLSTFLRNVGMGAVPSRAPLDLKAVAALTKVNGDQARLGNLLKLYLQDPAPDHAAARRLLDKIWETQGELKAAALRVPT